MANYDGAEQCDLCPAGSYCLISGVPVPCEAGFYCPAGTGSDLKPCPRGTYGPERSYSQISDCKPCPAGKYCFYENATTYTGLCDPGHWCSYGIDRPKPIGVNITALSNSTNSSCFDGRESGYGGRCHVGHYCPAGTDFPMPCSNGSYSPMSGLDRCFPCMEGYYCPFTNMTDFHSYKCPEGHYCPNGTVMANQYSCPIGKYSATKGNTKPEDCQSCPPGRYCPREGTYYYKL